MKKNIYISTYCVISSYGSILQSYALKKALSYFEVSSAIISPKGENDISKYQYYRKNNSPKNIIFNLIKAKEKKKVYKRLTQNLLFIKKNIDLLQYESVEQLKNTSFDSNIFLAGSDQIFHPALCDPTFFLDFTPVGAKRISYAASMGSLSISKEKENEFARLINNFDCLSFRENDAADLAKKYTIHDIQVHIDPTFLLEANEWRRIEKEYPIKGKYILLYPIFWSKTFNEQLRVLHKKTGLPIVVVSDSMGIYHQKAVHDAGIEQFLWLIDHAEYVITSSFHGAALSLNFNKKVSMIINPAQPSRLKCLADTLQCPTIPIEQIDTSEIDYEIVNKKIGFERERSIAYLKKVLCDE